MTTEPSKELCYPFADRTCSDPRCSCRREKLAALKATATEPSDRDRRDAEALFNEWYKNEGATDTKLIRSIARALAAARAVPDGHVRLPNGKCDPCRFVTADGALALVGDTVYVPGWSSGFIVTERGTIPVAVKTEKVTDTWRDMRVCDCYSTREALEAAAAARGGER